DSTCRPSGSPEAELLTALKDPQVTISDLYVPMRPYRPYRERILVWRAGFRMRRQQRRDVDLDGLELLAPGPYVRDPSMRCDGIRQAGSGCVTQKLNDPQQRALAGAVGAHQDVEAAQIDGDVAQDLKVLDRQRLEAAIHAASRPRARLHRQLPGVL